MGVAEPEYDRGWGAVHERAGSGEVGRGALYGDAGQEIEFGADVDASNPERREDPSLRIRLVSECREWTSPDRARRGLARIHNEYFALCRRRANGDRNDQPRRRPFRSREDCTRRSRDLRETVGSQPPLEVG